MSGLRRWRLQALRERLGSHTECCDSGTGAQMGSGMSEVKDRTEWHKGWSQEETQVQKFTRGK